MQTFLPLSDFAKSAAALDQRRLGKQRVENLQILSSLTGLHLENTSEQVPTGRFRTRYIDPDTDQVTRRSDMVAGKTYEADRYEVVQWRDLPESEWLVVPNANKGWSHHPAVKMWVGHEWTFADYHSEIVSEWVDVRENSDTCRAKFFKIFYAAFPTPPDDLDRISPPWLGDADFHRSHQSNLIRKDADHYGPQFPGVPGDLPYIWPSPAGV